jgi:transcriptional regulator with XRE-family HTH domain
MNPAAKTLDREIGQRLRTTRLMRGLSQTQVGQILGVSFQQIQKYEKGVNGLSPARMKRYAESLDVTIYYILGESEVDPPMLPPMQASQQKQGRLTPHIRFHEQPQSSRETRAALSYFSLLRCAGECIESGAFGSFKTVRPSGIQQANPAGEITLARGWSL